MDLFKFLEIAREAAYCLLFSIGEFKSYAAALKRIGSVTTFQAMRYLDIYDPRPRKLELLAAGYDIALVWDRAITESGEVHRIGRYVLMTFTREEAA